MSYVINSEGRPFVRSRMLDLVKFEKIFCKLGREQVWVGLHGSKGRDWQWSAGLVWEAGVWVHGDYARICCEEDGVGVEPGYVIWDGPRLDYGEVPPCAGFVPCWRKPERGLVTRKIPGSGLGV